MTASLSAGPFRTYGAAIALAATAAGLAGPGAAFAQPDRVILQYFEASWNTMRKRMPDVFTAGYGAVWTPPPQKGQAGGNSIGYDLFDRFDLGTGTSPTRYGTEADLRLAIAAYHRANVHVYVDWIMNHNGTWDHNTPNFIAQGGYPGFVLQIPDVDTYGDFNAYANGCPQSTNPGDACYDLFNGRLLGLIDIAQIKNHLYIRHPTVTDPNNIPAGTIYNRVNAANARFYADTDLTPTAVTNPGTNRNPGVTNSTIYPFNTADPMQGDPVLENATALLLRATRWMLEEIGVDGFRLDAAKHTPTWFWDTYWDTAVFERHRDFDAVYRTPYSFVEAVEGGGIAMQDWVRKPGEPGSGWPAQGWEFGNRDALDLNEAGALRDLVSADGAGSWGNVLSSSVDNRDDGFNNGTIGVHHVNSHDNAIADDEDDSVAHAYVLMRTGVPVVYYAALQFGNPPNNFPRANGRDDALGLGGDLITKLVQIRNAYARGWFVPINDTDPVNQSIADVLVFVRRKPLGGSDFVDNLLVAVNDREVSGEVQTRNVATRFPAGTRLHELTGNATDPLVDPAGAIPDILVVDAEGRLADAANPSNLYLKIPSNRGSRGTRHGRGYVIYGPAAPSGTLTITNVDEVLPPDDESVPAHARRLTPVDVIRADSFEIQLQTSQTDTLDPNTDDAAVFRIDSGYADYNGNGGVDHPTGFSAGAEIFLTQNSPLFGGGTGTYRQVIDATQLAEGYHYVSVWAYRHRADGGDPIFRDFRRVIYVDRGPPVVTLVSPTQTGNGDITSSTYTAVVTTDDPTTTAVHIFPNRHYTTDFVALAQAGQNPATPDGLNFRRTIQGAHIGNHRLDVVAFDELGNASVSSFVGINATTPFYGGFGDINNDFAIDARDIEPFVALATEANLSFHPAADFNGDGLNDVSDVPGFVAALLGLP